MNVLKTFRYLCLIACGLLYSNEALTNEKVKDHVGCKTANYADWRSSNYILPYPTGKKYRVDLSNCSSSYHSEGYPDQFAIDFKMRKGTLITAARGGEVVHIEENGRSGKFPNNLVSIEHEDGTVMSYMHLKRNGALVEIGDIVKQGQAIARSGDTGLAGYPHLHLVLLPSKTSYPYQSLPITFQNTTPNPRGLASNTYYKAQITQKITK